MQSIRISIVLVFNQKGEVFVTKRSQSKEKNPSLYEIGQGGKLNEGESYEEAAKRELLEELGIASARLNYLFDFSFALRREQFDARIYTCRHEGKMKLNAGEIEEGFYIHPDALRKAVDKNPENYTPDSTEFIKKYQEFMRSH